MLDFRLTEQILGDDGHQLATWLEVSHASHDIALVTGPNGGLHHFAFWLSTTGTSCATPPTSSPTTACRSSRPDPPRGHARVLLYFFDPLGNRNEVFTGGYWVDPDHEPVDLDRGRDGPGACSATRAPSTSGS